MANSASTVPFSWGLTCSFHLADRGALHKAISLENDIHIIEETQLFQDFEPIQSLLLSSKKVSPRGLAGQPHISVTSGRAGPGRPGRPSGPDEPTFRLLQKVLP